MSDTDKKHTGIDTKRPDISKDTGAGTKAKPVPKIFKSNPPRHTPKEIEAMTLKARKTGKEREEQIKTEVCKMVSTTQPPTPGELAAFAKDAGISVREDSNQCERITAYWTHWRGWLFEIATLEAELKYRLAQTDLGKPFKCEETLDYVITKRRPSLAGAVGKKEEKGRKDMGILAESIREYTEDNHVSAIFGSDEDTKHFSQAEWQDAREKWLTSFLTGKGTIPFACVCRIAPIYQRRLSERAREWVSRRKDRQK
jgi:hypothetical protein